MLVCRLRSFVISVQFMRKSIDRGDDFDSCYIFLSPESDQDDITNLHGSCLPLPLLNRRFFGGIQLCVFPQTCSVSLPACSPHFPFNAKRQAGKL